MSDTLNLFVYGSLRPGGPLWESYLKPISLEVTDNVTTKAALWMTKEGAYPWMTEGSQIVTGTLASVINGPELHRLSVMEIGAGYQVAPVEVFVGRVVVEAITFLYPHVHEGFIPVPGQDWSWWCGRPEAVIGIEGWQK